MVLTYVAQRAGCGRFVVTGTVVAIELILLRERIESRRTIHHRRWTSSAETKTIPVVTSIAEFCVSTNEHDQRITLGLTHGIDRNQSESIVTNRNRRCSLICIYVLLMFHLFPRERIYPLSMYRAPIVIQLMYSRPDADAFRCVLMSRYKKETKWKRSLCE